MTDEALQLQEDREARKLLAEQYRDRFTTELDEFVRERLPLTMSNDHYEAGTTGMLVALARVTSQCVVAWGETYGIEAVKAQLATRSQLDEDFGIAYQALADGLAPQGMVQ